eukprot:TRINITY_DN20995_c0_g1_i1.p2 TRINITY_DN20995_c0_g1~~TRINITY_DN20995_c0_g1_i1.p2  ORF type:complete len:443 (+),score=98.84 TRINITY_DN20995_c0_g1_i1:159-1487(+)
MMVRLVPKAIFCGCPARKGFCLLLSRPQTGPILPWRHALAWATMLLVGGKADDFCSQYKSNLDPPNVIDYAMDFTSFDQDEIAKQLLEDVKEDYAAGGTVDVLGCESAVDDIRCPHKKIFQQTLKAPLPVSPTLDVEVDFECFQGLMSSATVASAHLKWRTPDHFGGNFSVRFDGLRALFTLKATSKIQIPQIPGLTATLALLGVHTQIPKYQTHHTEVQVPVERFAMTLTFRVDAYCDVLTQKMLIAVTQVSQRDVILDMATPHPVSNGLSWIGTNLCNKFGPLASTCNGALKGLDDTLMDKIESKVLDEIPKHINGQIVKVMQAKVRKKQIPCANAMAIVQAVQGGFLSNTNILILVAVLAIGTVVTAVVWKLYQRAVNSKARCCGIVGQQDDHNQNDGCAIQAMKLRRGEFEALGQQDNEDFPAALSAYARGAQASAEK